MPPDYKGELPESGYFVQKMRTTRATMPDELNVRAGHRVAGNGTGNVRLGLRYRHLQSTDRLSDRRLGGGYALRQTEYRAGRGQIIALEFRSAEFLHSLDPKRTIRAPQRSDSAPDLC